MCVLHVSDTGAYVGGFLTVKIALRRAVGTDSDVTQGPAVLVVLYIYKKPAARMTSRYDAHCGQ